MPRVRTLPLDDVAQGHAEKVACLPGGRRVGASLPSIRVRWFLVETVFSRLFTEFSKFHMVAEP